MNKTIAVLITATVLVLTALITLTMFTTGIGDFGQSADDQKSTGCQFQAENADKPGDLSSKCREDPRGEQAFLSNDEEVIDSVT